MLTKLARQSHEMREETVGYGGYGNDNENGNDGERERRFQQKEEKTILLRVSVPGHWHMKP